MIFFTSDNLIYLPNDNYYYCEHLPEEWIDVIKKLNEGSKNSYAPGNSINLNN